MKNRTRAALSSAPFFLSAPAAAFADYPEKPIRSNCCYRAFAHGTRKTDRTRTGAVSVLRAS